MRICTSCGGKIGEDCFDQVECARTTADDNTILNTERNMVELLQEQIKELTNERNEVRLACAAKDDALLVAAIQLKLVIERNPLHLESQQCLAIMNRVISPTIGAELMDGLKNAKVALLSCDKRIQTASSMFCDKDWNLGCSKDLGSIRAALAAIERVKI